MYALLSALGVPLNDILPFAGSLSIELQQITENETKRLIFKVFYSSDTITFNKVPLPGCNEGKECTLEEFIK